MTTSCTICGDAIPQARANLGKRTCLFCGEEQARLERASWCVAPLHKSNYVLITNPLELKGINVKGPR